ncbi:DUF2953 domain-containing protein [Hydrogenoanaerobacterium sp.]|uniref:DUF2953 domain-containing protein n=1 Tax=Hydrogenoanaerobacterium sp. TaxID=2953763 RepID=UPI002898D25B|nr:DUF2953 domain-containing protein [Hydrogenoanaerobacterium sp.]
MIIFLCVLGVLLFLLCMPVSVWICWEDKLQVWIGYLFFKIQVNTPEEDAEKLAKEAEKQAKKGAERELKKKEKQTGGKPQALTDMVGIVLDLVQSATGGLRMILRNLRVCDLTLHMTVAAEDASDTAVNYGKTSAYLYGAYAALQNYIKMKRVELDIRPDFLSDEGSFTLRFCVQITPIIALGAALRIGASFLWKMIKRGAASSGNRTAAPQKKEEPAGKT